MLCTFTIKPRKGTPEDRTLVIQSADIKQIAEDDYGHTFVRWLVGTEVYWERITGTARENMERLQREELEAITRVNTFQQSQQQRIDQGLPVVPVGRGKAGR